MSTNREKVLAILLILALTASALFAQIPMYLVDNSTKSALSVIADPCADPSRLTNAVISESTAATNEIVSLTASNIIYVCSYKFVTTAANSLKWVRGTGTDCATGLTDIEGAQPYAANGGAAESGGGTTLFTVASGNALCLNSSVATVQGGRVTYVKTSTP